MREKFVFIFIIVFLLNDGLRAQSNNSSVPNVADYTKLSDFLPPSPQASSISKFGALDVGLSTGTVSFNIPLTKLEVGNLSLPISINYFSSGLKVDEISSSVGVGWSLNAGGVITRTVLGAPDEDVPRPVPPTNFSSRAAIQYMRDLSISPIPAFDGQPDIFTFNFNGNQGKFILDENLNPILISSSPLKIENDFSANATWRFKITTIDGVEYFFGENATEITSKYSSGQAGKTYRQFIETGWYLTKIIHPNSQQITLSYDSIGYNYVTSISETVYSPVRTSIGYINPSYACDCEILERPNLENIFSKNWLRVLGVRLKEIKALNNNQINFTYVDRTDVGGIGLLTKIESFNSKNEIIKKYELNYFLSTSNLFLNTYSNSNPSFKIRYFLTSLTEKSADNVFQNNHYFEYNDFSNLPPRLTYAQDHYGFYNGKNNTTLIPSHILPSWKKNLPLATANREIDENFCSKGVLKKIVYPTGGSEEIYYEANEVYKQVKVLQPKINIEAYGNSLGMQNGNLVISPTAYNLFEQEVIFYGACSYNVPPNPGDPTNHNKTIIKIKDITTGSIVDMITLYPGDTYSNYIKLLPNRNYVIESRAMGEEVYGGGRFEYIPGVISTQLMNVKTGGLRVQKIITQDGITNKSSIKKYYYNRVSDNTISSGLEVSEPKYEKILKLYKRCRDGNKSNCSYITSVDDQELLLATICNIAEYEYYSMYSNSLNNLFPFGGSLVSYEYVTESFGENFENGGILHQYTQIGDAEPDIIFGESFMSALSTSFSNQNGKEIYTQYFSKSNNIKKNKKEIFTNYADDIREKKTFTSFIATQKYLYPCSENNPPSEEELKPFDFSRSRHFVNWVYPNEVKTRVYDENGQNYLEEKSTFEYNGLIHKQLTKLTTISSKNSENSLKIYYPHDLFFYGNEEQARQSLIAKKTIGVPLVKETYSQNNLLNSFKTEYKNFQNGLTLPFKNYLKKGSNNFEEVVSFNQYDDYGNLLEQQKINDIPECYFWGYNNQYPVAKVIGKTYNEMLSLSGIDVAILNNPSTTDIAMRTELAKLRIVQGCLVTSYTYKPLIGITSETDPQGKTMYYEYDSFNRLKLIRDKDNNILKTFDYKYQQQQN